MHTGVTPVQLFKSEFIKLDGTLAGHTIATSVCGGIFRDENQDNKPIIPWSGTDPDSKVNYHSWFKDDSKLQIPRYQHLPKVKSMKGPCHIGMLWPTIAKHTKVVQDTYMTYRGTHFNGLPKSNEVHPSMTICHYKATVHQHMINNGVWDILNIPDQQTAVSWFHHPAPPTDIHLILFQLSIPDIFAQ
eukprot:2770617-Ditylum_brightwellii.AAC.1